MIQFLTHNWHDFKKKETRFSAQLEIQDGHQYGRRHLEDL